MEEENVLVEGPIDPTVLTFQPQHRSHALWENMGDRPLDCTKVNIRRVEGSLKRMARPAPPVADLIREAGFGGLMDLPFMSVDLGLVTALLERWRPETHTFHFLSGEATVTLQDVEVLLGLPVDGPAVIGRIPTGAELDMRCQELLGRVPVNRNRTGAKLLLSWLRTHFTGQLPDGFTEVDVQRQARGYIMQLIGGMVAPDHSGSHVHGCYLYLLEDLRAPRSWGSACLAALYHYLCVGATRGVEDIGGPMFLLQLWAWERLPYLAPGRVGKRFPAPNCPLGARWGDDFTNPDLATHVLASYRNALDLQKPDEVVWTPYSDELIDSLPPMCRGGRAIWMAKVPLICFPFVQEHMPDRVKRQFGFRQHIPDDCNCRGGQGHGNDFKTGPKNVIQSYAEAIARWDNRLEAVVDHGEPDIAGAYPESDQYVQWYNRITIRHTSRMGAAADIGMRVLAGIHAMDVDPDVNRMCKQGMACMGFFHKWMRKTPPEQPQPPPPHEEPGDDPGVDQMGAEPQAQPQGQAYDGPPLQMFDEQAEVGGGGGGGGVEYPSPLVIDIPFQNWRIESPFPNMPEIHTSFTDRPMIKRRRMDGEGTSATAAHIDESTADIYDTPIQSSCLFDDTDVQGDAHAESQGQGGLVDKDAGSQSQGQGGGEGDGVVTQVERQGPVEVAQDPDDDQEEEEENLVRRSRRVRQPPRCGTGGHLGTHT